MRIYDFDKFSLGKYAYDGCEPKSCVGDGRYIYIVKEPRPIKSNASQIKEKRESDFYFNCISEYFGCHIFALCGIDTQETYLGYYTCKDGIKRLCVACKDFTTDEKYLTTSGESAVKLCPMANYKHDFTRDGDKNKTLISRDDGEAYLDELENIWHKSKYLSNIENKIIIEYYNRFVVDGLIGNPDRHNGNWGFLIPASDERHLQEAFGVAPVYDCGASFLSRANQNRLDEVLKIKELLKRRCTDFPKSQVSKKVGIKDGIEYGSYFNSLENKNLNEAILRMTPIIKEALPQIYKLIDEMENKGVITHERANFYKIFIDGRFKNIIQKPYNELKNIQEGSKKKQTGNEMD